MSLVEQKHIHPVEQAHFLVSQPDQMKMALLASDKLFLNFSSFLFTDILGSDSETLPVLESILLPSHVGFLSLGDSVDSVSRTLANSGYLPFTVFESTVVASQLRGKYGRNDIVVDIIKARTAEKIPRQLEVFVAKGLNEEQKKTEIPFINHFALSTRLVKIEEQVDLIEMFFGLEFSASGGGLNAIENVTVLYFRTKGGTKIELLLQGENPTLLTKHLSRTT